MCRANWYIMRIAVLCIDSSWLGYFLDTELLGNPECFNTFTFIIIVTLFAQDSRVINVISDNAKYNKANDSTALIFALNKQKWKAWLPAPLRH